MQVLPLYVEGWEKDAQSRSVVMEMGAHPLLRELGAWAWVWAFIVSSRLGISLIEGPAGDQTCGHWRWAPRAYLCT